MSENLDLIVDWPERRSDEIAFDARHDALKSYKNCYIGFGSIWQVKLFLGKQQRLLGYSHNKFRAIRFADMALVYFLPYRKQRNRPMFDTDLNLGMDSAKRDLDSIPGAVNILSHWRSALMAKGLIEPQARLFDEASHDATSIRKALALHFHELRVSFGHAKKLLGTHPTLVLFDEHLIDTEKYLKSTDTLLKDYE